MQELKIQKETVKSLLFAMNGELISKYVIITDWNSHFYISYPNTDSFKKLRGRIYMSRNFLPSIIDFEDGWQLLYTDNLEQALDEFSEKFKDEF